MGSIGSMSGLYIGVSGLQVNQVALNTTAHNLSNLDSEGYSRQQILIRDSLYSVYKHGAVYTNQTGLGATMEKIRQVRDTFADVQYRLETGRQSFYESMNTVADEVETYFGEDIDNQELKLSMTKFWESLNELQKTPDSIVSRETVILAAQQIVDQAKLIYDQVTDYQKNLNEQIQKQVDTINDIGKKISELNVKIAKVEASKVESANDLRDRRNTLLDQLSQYVDITYREDGNGYVNVNIEGTAFVTEDYVYELGTQKISKDSQLYDVVWKSHGDMPLYHMENLPTAEDETDVGSLKGLLFARGTKAGSYTMMDGSHIDLSQYVDASGNQKYATVEEFCKGEGYGDYSGYYEKEVAPYFITNVQAQLDFLMHTIVTKVNNILCPNTTTQTDITAQDADGNTITIAAGTTVLDTAKAPISMGENGKPGIELFTRANVSRYKEYTYTDANGKEQTLYVYNEEKPDDVFSQYTIDQLIINPDVVKNPSLIPLSNQDHSNAQDVVNELLDSWSCEGKYKDTMQTLTPNTLTGYNIQGYYNAMVNDIANASNSYYNIAQNQQKVANKIDDRRQIVAGVSSADELSNMIMFQQGYNAASRYINVVAEMLDTLVNKMG